MIRRLLILAMFCAAGAARAATPEELLKDAQQLEKSGSTQKAAALYDQFLKQNPDHSQVVEARYRLAKCQDAMGMVDEAIAGYKAVTADEKKGFRSRPDAFYSLGKLYASNKKYDEATATFERMLNEGAGLFEEEVLNLAGGYYAILGKYDNAAAKFNILKSKADPKQAEDAAYKLSMLWLRAEKMDQAVAAIQDLANAFPRNAQIPELLLRAADEFRKKGAFDKTISLAEQIRQRYPKTPEALGANYLLGLCYRDKKDFQKAADALDEVGKAKDPATRGIAAEAVLQSADVYFRDLKDADKAMARYEEAAKIARESEGARKNEILEQCYFRLGEQHFMKKNYAAALDFYSLMRATGTKVNILGRIVDCQAQLNKTSDAITPETVSETDVELIRKKIAERPGTAEAAEAEIFLLDRRFTELAKKRNASAAPLAAEYEKLAAAYPKEVLAGQSMGAYVWQMTGLCYAGGSTREEMAKAIGAFERAIAFDDTGANPYRQPALENIAQCAERAGDKARAAKAYAALLELSKQQLAAKKGDKAVEAKTLDYLKSLATRSDTPDLMDGTIALTKQMIEEQGPLSDLSRESRFYLGELYYLKKDFSAAAKTFKEFIVIYGPKQAADGGVAGGPWKPAKFDERTQQIYEAATRIAHAWYMQGHDQNMVAAYKWVVENFPEKNRHVAEAQYWLCLEMLKGKAGETKEAKRRAAEALWTLVVNPSLDFEGSGLKKKYYFWVTDEDAQKYVRGAMMKAGQLFSEVEDHESAAGVFSEFLNLYGGRQPVGRKGKSPGAGDRDEMVEIARYALGREFISLKRTAKLVEAYKPYLNGCRDDRFRISGLRQLAYHAGRDGLVPEAIDAYATLLDEYGESLNGRARVRAGFNCVCY